MSEKIVSVEVRMVTVGPNRDVVTYVGSERCHIHQDTWTPAMHAAAEELRAQGAELGENQWRDERGYVLTLSEPTLSGFSWHWSFWEGSATRVADWGLSFGIAQDFVLAWHSRAYTLLPDECREQGKPPRKMVDGEVRLPSGKPVEMRLCGRFAVKVDLGDYYSSALLCHPDVSRHIDSPFRDPAQYARGLAWWIKNAPADLCLTDDGLSVRTMAPNEVRDVVTGKARTMEMDDERVINLGCPYGWASDSVVTDKLCKSHPCSLPSNRLRVEAFLKASTCACNGTGRKTEESDAQGVAMDGQAAQPKATAASVHEEPATGATERAQSSASDASIVGDGADPLVLAGAGAACRASSPAPGDVPPEVTRPLCIPSHIADTDWTVIEGRAVWRENKTLFIDDGDAYPFVIELQQTWDEWNALPDNGAITPVPQPLFLAARRWMGWEKEETAQGPVPRAAMWNVVGDGAFAEPFGTIRKCADCGCLVAGGPTRCGRCAEGGAP